MLQSGKDTIRSSFIDSSAASITSTALRPSSPVMSGCSLLQMHSKKCSTSSFTAPTSFPFMVGQCLVSGNFHPSRSQAYKSIGVKLILITPSVPITFIRTSPNPPQLLGFCQPAHFSGKHQPISWIPSAPSSNSIVIQAQS